MKALPIAGLVRDLLVPWDSCGMCGGASEGGPAPGLCRACWHERRRPRGPSCPVCGMPLPPVEGQEDHACGACLADPPAFDGHVSAYLYAGPVRHLVLLYKDGRRYPLAALMGTAAARAAKRRWPGASWDAVVWVPSPFGRRFRRGFEPAGLVALEAARKLGLPARRFLNARKSPEPQKGLSAAARRENVRAAFAARPGLKGLRVLLVDDVTTTGATIREAARILVRAGAEVHAVTFAMAVRRDLELHGAGVNPEGATAPERGDAGMLPGPPASI